ncbi:MAG: HAMP domain-containing protein, partial [Propionibacteriaceae bacterium]|nr:HAMP domain-containing protein [Propionibacteriaceae bacterium]
MSDIDVARIRHGLGAPLRLWKSSLALRVVTSALLGSFLVLMVAGVFLLYSVTQGIISNARESAMADASEALSEIEQQMRALGYDYASSDAIDSIVRAAITRGDSSGRYELYVITGTGRFSSNGFDQSAVPIQLRQSVADDQQSQQVMYSQSTQVQLASGLVVPGLAVASTTSGGGLDRFLVYFVFDFQQESRTLTVVQTAVGLSGLVVMIGIGLVAYLISRQTLRPVRLARQAAEKLASGELTQLMPVRGTDDLDQLAMSMN